MNSFLKRLSKTQTLKGPYITNNLIQQGYRVSLYSTHRTFVFILCNNKLLLFQASTNPNFHIQSTEMSLFRKWWILWFKSNQFHHKPLKFRLSSKNLMRLHRCRKHLLNGGTQNLNRKRLYTFLLRRASQFSEISHRSSLLYRRLECLRQTRKVKRRCMSIFQNQRNVSWGRNYFCLRKKWNGGNKNDNKTMKKSRTWILKSLSYVMRVTKRKPNEWMRSRWSCKGDMHLKDLEKRNKSNN